MTRDSEAATRIQDARLLGTNDDLPLGAGWKRPVLLVVDLDGGIRDGHAARPRPLVVGRVDGDDPLLGRAVELVDPVDPEPAGEGLPDLGGHAGAVGDTDGVVEISLGGRLVVEHHRQGAQVVDVGHPLLATDVPEP